MAMPCQIEAEALKKSSWPKCDQLAEDLAVCGPSNADALEAAASSRTRHVEGKIACLTASP